MARKDLLEDAATQALLAAGRDAAKRAAGDLLSTDEERAADEAERARASKRRRWKLIVGAVLALFVLIGVIGMLVSYWQWFLVAGLLGFGGAFAWWRLRSRLAARRTAKVVKVEASKEPTVVRAEAPARRAREAAGDASRREAAEEARDALARAEAEATEQQSVEEELQALKARIKR